MKNRIISVLAGIFSGWIVVTIGDAINHCIFPAPENLNFNDKSAIREFMESLPVQAFLSMLLVLVVSAFVGGMVTGKLAKTNWVRLSLITGGILLVASVGNMFLIPHPMWFNIIAALLYLPMAYLGGRYMNKM